MIHDIEPDDRPTLMAFSNSTTPRNPHNGTRDTYCGNRDDTRAAGARIVRTPDVCSGKPRIDDTRWPTEIVVGFDFDRWAVLAGYPHLTRDQVDAAIAYERRWHRRFGRWIERQRERLRTWLLREDAP